MKERISPSHTRLVLNPEPLSQPNFSQYGDVIENPVPSLVPGPNLKVLPPGAALGNQGSALVYADITRLSNFYSQAPSKTPSKAAMRMFSCAPRALLPAQDSNIEGNLEISILERHPYTSQTFIPIGLSAAEQGKARYLVIVAPTLSPSPQDKSLPVPDGTPGRGLPDLTRIKAFVATGRQAITYGAGTWHAPMIAIGIRPVDFVVVQSLNGVALEDCQEASWTSDKGNAILVAVPKAGYNNHGLWSSKL
ncbi:ureidoglycolate hydrolase-like protein [Bisporella sp. PMI_857]|nr:ureidoglycolate hydrolase-like protein [Bisporella sp. PMI_857]